MVEENGRVVETGKTPVLQDKPESQEQPAVPEVSGSNPDASRIFNFNSCPNCQSKNLLWESTPELSPEIVICLDCDFYDWQVPESLAKAYEEGNQEASDHSDKISARVRLIRKAQPNYYHIYTPKGASKAEAERLKLVVRGMCRLLNFRVATITRRRSGYDVVLEVPD